MSSQRGFTLIELAIVLVIVTILIGGLAMPLSAQIQARRIAEAKKTLEEAREAILGYAMNSSVTPPCTCTYNVDGDGDSDTSTCPVPSSCPVIFPPTIGTTLTITRHYLPCPDAQSDPEPGVDNDGDGNMSDANNGREDRKADGTCLKDTGNLPWVTLGAAAQDAWGNRLRYAVHADLSSKTNGFHNGSAPTPGDPWNQVCSEKNCPVVDVAADVPVVLVSYGANGRGARNVNIPFGSPTPALPPGTSANEIENLDADHRYVSRPPSKPGDAAGEFDDLVAWLPFSVLINRVCPAGGCP
ncbi:MAG TPA: prepilin-type N-terminal cleavage/methylation domain-containing protein [Thiobacillus sp.]|nr:prepilin-type N-terminal cleavage/methylation domain-containing protein [Thiobacillus sp.]